MFIPLYFAILISTYRGLSHPMRMKMATFMGKLLLFLSVYVSQVKAQAGRAYRKFVSFIH